MSRFFASTAKGLVEVLENELHSLGIQRTERAMGGVFFDGNWKTVTELI
jgi:23S rRNA G2445 N2-methylase RlmL